MFSNSFTLKVYRLWNPLPPQITTIENRSRFESSLKSLYLERADGCKQVILAIVCCDCKTYKRVRE